jgi:hypothetical protein
MAMAGLPGLISCHMSRREPIMGTQPTER